MDFIHLSCIVPMNIWVYSKYIFTKKISRYVGWIKWILLPYNFYFSTVLIPTIIFLHHIETQKTLNIANPTKYHEIQNIDEMSDFYFTHTTTSSNKFGSCKKWASSTRTCSTWHRIYILVLHMYMHMNDDITRGTLLLAPITLTQEGHYYWHP